MKMLKRFLDDFRPYRPYVARREEWNFQYQSGRWDYLDSLEELGHYSVVAGYCCFHGTDKSILDIGCGDGVLLTRLHGRYGRYLGVDVSEEAIKRALHRQDERTRFIVADAEHFAPSEAFDLIVLNECLYYLTDPVAILNRLSTKMNEGGRIIVSMHRNSNSRRLWPTISDRFPIEDAVSVRHEQSRNVWDIKLLKSPSA